MSVGNIHSIGTFGSRGSSTALGEITSIGTFGWWEDTDVTILETIRLSSSLMTLLAKSSKLSDTEVSISSGIKISEEFRSNLI